MKHPMKIALAMMLVCAGGNVAAQTAYDPVPVSKTRSNKIYAHVMPWFESKPFSGYWGIHWTMTNRNPDVVDASGRRQIAAHYYPLIGPYASADPDLIEYQLLTMKLAGVDSVLIDWPGTTRKLDYERNKSNAEALIAKVKQVGLEFSVMYEDHNLDLGGVADKRGQARADMAYLRDNYFNKPSYSRIDGKPLLLVFGPQTLTKPEDWSDAFSVLPTKPSFLTLWYEHADAGNNSNGDFAWIYQDANPYVEHHLANFYKVAANYGVKMGAVAPGFRDYYTEGGWERNGLVIEHNGLGTFQKSLDLALANNVQHIQLATWNDYGEGTMIEPTREFGYGFLTSLQQRLGVSYRQQELELVKTLYDQRKQYAGDPGQKVRLDQVFYYLASLQIANARELLNGGGGGNPSKPIRVEAENFAVMHGIGVEACSEGGRNIGWIDNGDWAVWNVTVPEAGTYRVEYRVSGIREGQIRLEGSYGKPVYGSIQVPNTGGWQKWTTVSHLVTLKAGRQELAINAPQGGFNINWFQLTRQP